jgi:hypothetical protein
MEFIIMQKLLEPHRARPEELIVAKSFLNRIIDYRHQWYERIERDHRKDGKDEPPGAIVFDLGHRRDPANQPFS